MKKKKLILITSSIILSLAFYVGINNYIFYSTYVDGLKSISKIDSIDYNKDTGR